jgi:septum site-determining protein MinC
MRIMNNTIDQSTKTAFQLKASSLTFTMLQLNTVNIDFVAQQLATLIAKTPNFFDNTPIVVDLTKIDGLNLPLDIAALLSTLKQSHLIPIGLRTANEAYQATAKTTGIACLSYAPAQSAAKTAQPKKTTAKATMVIDQAVRSGKQIYAKGSDLIINATVSHGAEILADGNIHVYGTLYGRALAGVQGDDNARIYCKSLDAELIAIAGNYLVNEQIPDEFKNLEQIVSVALQQQKLDFKKL